jgi:hypothetical protein
VIVIVLPAGADAFGSVTVPANPAMDGSGCVDVVLVSAKVVDAGDDPAPDPFPGGTPALGGLVPLPPQAARATNAIAEARDSAKRAMANPLGGRFRQRGRGI